MRAIQLHGGQSADFAEEIAETGCEIWRAVWLDSEATLAEAEAFPCAALIADSRSKVAVGGTGELSDWALAKKLAAKRRLVLAGGISPENAEAAIRAVQPWAVDSNSAVEISPGKKDLKKVQILIEKVRNII